LSVAGVGRARRANGDSFAQVKFDSCPRTRRAAGWLAGQPFFGKAGRNQAQVVCLWTIGAYSTREMWWIWTTA